MIRSLTWCLAKSLATPHGVLDAAVVAGAVADDADARHAQQRCAAVFVVVVLGQHSAGRPCLIAPPWSGDGGGHLAEHRLDHALGHAFDELEHHVADEAVADHHVAGAAEQVAPLDVADEVDSSGRPSSARGSA